MKLVDFNAAALALAALSTVSLQASAEQQTFDWRDASLEQISQAITEAGGKVTDIQRNAKTGLIESMTASGSGEAYEYDPEEMSEVLESLHATGVTPTRLTGDLAQTSTGTSGGTETQLLGLMEWTIDFKIKSVDSTTTDDLGAESSLPSTYSWTAKAKWAFISGDTGQTTNLLGALQGTKQILPWNFFPTVATGREVFKGSGYIDGGTVTAGTGKLVGHDVSIKGIGYLTTGVQIAPVGTQAEV